MSKFKNLKTDPTKEERTYFAVSITAGYPLTIEEINISSEDEDYDEDEFVDFEDYVKYTLEETEAEAAQHFSSIMIFTPEQIMLILNHFNTPEMSKKLSKLI